MYSLHACMPTKWTVPHIECGLPRQDIEFGLQRTSQQADRHSRPRGRGACLQTSPGHRLMYLYTHIHYHACQMCIQIHANCGNRCNKHRMSILWSQVSLFGLLCFELGKGPGTHDRTKDCENRNNKRMIAVRHDDDVPVGPCESVESVCS